VNGLSQIPNSQFYALMESNGQTIGARPGFHTDNHNMTTGAAQKLMILAIYYHLEFPNDPVLHLNDASLPWGGVYDICARPTACPTQGVTPWVEPHKGHRRGTVVDIRANGDTTAIPRTNFAMFIRLLTLPKYAINAKFIPEDLETTSTNGHFHVEFAGHQE